MMVDLSLEVCGKIFKNPVVVSSATPTKSAYYMKKAFDAGAGGAVAKSVTTEPLLQKYVRPRFTVLHKKGWPHVYSNYSCEFLSTIGPEAWLKEMKKTKEYAEDTGAVLIGSIVGRTFDEWGKLGKMMEEVGADMIELDLGCPHPRELHYKSSSEIGQDPEAAALVTKVVKEATTIPVFSKLTPEAVNVVTVAQAVEKAGADGITAINRFPALEVDIETGRPLLHSTFAGVGGPWMRPITLKWIAKLARSVKIPISATNGIATWKDAVKCIMCGASTVQVCTAIMYSGKGYRVVSDIIKGMQEFMDRKGYKNINDFKGITLKQLLTFETVNREAKIWSVVDDKKCTGCKLCPNWCFYDAITFETKNKKPIATIDKRKCDGCGLCISLCPAQAIHMEGKGPVFLGDFE